MRIRHRDKQKVYVVSVTESQSGIDTVLTYSKPKAYKVNVSAITRNAWQNRDVLWHGNGLEERYSRYILSFKKLPWNEGDQIFVDVNPILDENGNLAYKADGVTPLSLPEYVITQCVYTAKDHVFRWILKEYRG